MSDLEPTHQLTVLHIHVVPGAKSDQIAGFYGDRLKVRVSAPPEGGKANKAICKLIAGFLGVKPRQVTLLSGHTSCDKTLGVEGMNQAGLSAALLKVRRD